MSQLAQIVLIEDNPADVYLLEEALREHRIQYQLHRFPDGDEALSALQDKTGWNPDLILLDLNLPKSDGQQILRELRSLPRLQNLPIAVLSSSQSPLDTEAANDAGATVFLRKPPTLDEFLQLGGEIRKLLSLQR